MRIFEYLDSRLIQFIDVSSRDDAIDQLINSLDEGKDLPEKEQFRSAVFQREDLVSTGIGMGVAIPHAKLKEIDHFFVVIGIQKGKGIEWNALDEAPVRLVFLIGGPENRQTEYLKILSMLTSAIRDVDLRKQLLAAEDSEQVLELFSRI